MSELEFLCVRCARHMKTCCQTSEVYTTLGDAARIAEFTERDGFTEYRRPKNPEYLDQDDDPLWRDRVFRKDQSRRVLRRRDNGACVFLGQHGCTLPLEVRPLVCRLYPFDYTEKGIKDELQSGCPLELLPHGRGLIEELVMNVDDAGRWQAQLYAEILLEPGA